MTGGYMEKTAIVDLSCSHTEIIDFSDEDKRNFIGTYGFGVNYIFNNQKAKIDALSQESIFGVLAGPLTGTSFPAVSRFVICGKSPLTGTWGDANGSGYFGPKMKFSGFDGIFIRGMAQKPSCIVLENGTVRIEDASELWVLDTYETEDKIKSIYGKEAEGICIGPSGERLSPISGVVTSRGRIAARGGLGALMGSKRIKAIVVKGNCSVNISDKEKFNLIKKKLLKQIKDGNGSAELLKTQGTPGIAHGSLKTGDMPIRNWIGSMEEIKNPEQFEYENMEKYKISKNSCYACPIGCWGYVMIGNGKFALKEPAHMPEYETIGAFGGYCLCDNFEAIIRCNDICNRAGLDSVSTGSAVSFAMACYEAGLINKKDTDGVELVWGNHKAIVKMTEMIAKNQGFGEILAKGVKIASAIIGKESEKFAIHVQGQELPSHDGRFFPNLGFIYAIDPTPGRHTRWSFASKPLELEKIYPDVRFDFTNTEFSGRAKAYHLYFALGHLIESFGTCLFGYNSTDVFTYPECYEAVTGCDIGIGDLMKAGERIGVMRQLFTVREGLNPANFKYPEFARGSLDKGPIKGIALDIDTMKKEFYDEMDWDLKTGLPSDKKLKELGLDNIKDF